MQSKRAHPGERQRGCTSAASQVTEASQLYMNPHYSSDFMGLARERFFFCKYRDNNIIHLILVEVKMAEPI